MFQAGKFWSFIMTIFLFYVLFSQVPIQAEKFEKKDIPITEYESTDDNYPYPVRNFASNSFNGHL